MKHGTEETEKMPFWPGQCQLQVKVEKPVDTRHFRGEHRARWLSMTQIKCLENCNGQVDKWSRGRRRSGFVRGGPWSSDWDWPTVDWPWQRIELEDLPDAIQAKLKICTRSRVRLREELRKASR